MELIKFRIKHYKSIRDSSWCWLASDVTTLAGKNESGKTAILEALRDFDADIESIPVGAMPIDKSGKPVIELCFKPDKSELDKIASESGVALEKDIRESIAKEGLTLIKDHEGNYFLGEEIADLINKKKNDENQKHIKAIQSSIEKLKKYEQLSNLADPNFEDEIEKVQTAVIGYAGQATAQVATITDESAKQKTTETIQSLTAESSALQKDDPSEKVLEKIIVPNFVFFSSFDHNLPFEIELAVAKDNEAVKDFAAIAGINFDELIQLKTIQERKNLLNRHSAIIAGDFKDCWKQGPIALSADIDGTKLILGAKEEGKTDIFTIEQRSKGFQWFLSFYLRMRANTREDIENIILIDEPGLYLHAKAQKDVLNVLEDVSENSQVIFTTHSPYLIDTDKLYRVRLILRDENGTHIEGKIHKGAGTEALTPIITAIGLDLTNEFSLAGKKNVLLEGITDYYFLQALREYFPKSKFNELNLIPCVGAQKIPQLISLLIGWNLGYAGLLDNDREGKRIANELLGKLSVPSEKVIFVSSQDDFSIEDVFTPNDFNAFVLENTSNNDNAISNSKFLKSQGLDKVLLAKNFFKKVQNNKSQIKLSDETLSAFKELFEKASAAFERKKD